MSAVCVLDKVSYCRGYEDLTFVYFLGWLIDIQSNFEIKLIYIALRLVISFLVQCIMNYKKLDYSLFYKNLKKKKHAKIHAITSSKIFPSFSVISTKSLQREIEKKSITSSTRHQKKKNCFD